MKKFYLSSLLFVISFLFSSPSYANDHTFFKSPSHDNSRQPSDHEVDIQTQPLQPIDPFTGKITRNKVRMRLQPSLDAPILRELNKDDLLSVVGESDEFYAILPPKDTKAYIFRTYVLDDIVEGNRVNVRLEPAIEAPVIAQLNSGDKVEGIISPLSSKWLEITPPPSTRFYVCKEYIEKIGPPEMLAKLEKRRIEVTSLLNSTALMAENELRKDYRDIHLDPTFSNLKTIIKEYPDFPKHVEAAKGLLTNTQESYLKKKIAYLEGIAYGVEHKKNSDSSKSSSPQPFEPQPQPELLPIPVKPSIPKEIIPDEIVLEELMNRPPKVNIDWSNAFDSNSKSGKMALWIPTEQALFDAWLVQEKGTTPQEFYDEQIADAIILKGLVEPYSRSIRNKPGDFLLISSATHLPIAYLYSTHVNLQEFAGQEITLQGVKRPNNNFAFPAYFVISVE